MKYFLVTSEEVWFRCIYLSKLWKTFISYILITKILFQTAQLTNLGLYFNQTQRQTSIILILISRQKPGRVKKNKANYNADIKDLFKVNNINTNDVIDVVLVSLLLTLNIIHTSFQCFYCWLWAGKCLLNCSKATAKVGGKLIVMTPEQPHTGKHIQVEHVAIFTNSSPGSSKVFPLRKRNKIQNFSCYFTMLETHVSL